MCSTMCDHEVPPCKMVGGIIFIWFSTSGPILFPFTCTGWPDSVIYIASWKGHDLIVEELLSRGADMNHQTKVSILMWCMFLQYYDIEQDFSSR